MHIVAFAWQQSIASRQASTALARKLVSRIDMNGSAPIALHRSASFAPPLVSIMTYAMVLDRGSSPIIRGCLFQACSAQQWAQSLVDSHVTEQAMLEDREGNEGSFCGVSKNLGATLHPLVYRSARSCPDLIRGVTDVLLW